jgi:hypothetical protein
LISYLFHVIEDVNITCVYVVDVYQHKNCEQWSRVVFELVQSVTCYTAKYCMLFAVCVLWFSLVSAVFCNACDMLPLLFEVACFEKQADSMNILLCAFILAVFYFCYIGNLREFIMQSWNVYTKNALFFSSKVHTVCCYVVVTFAGTVSRCIYSPEDWVFK